LFRLEEKGKAGILETLTGGGKKHGGGRRAQYFPDRGEKKKGKRVNTKREKS